MSEALHQTTQTIADGQAILEHGALIGDREGQLDTATFNCFERPVALACCKRKISVGLRRTRWILLTGSWKSPLISLRQDGWPGSLAYTPGKSHSWIQPTG